MTKIEWTRGDDGAEGASSNPIRARNLGTGGLGHYCAKVSPGCDHCYAERMQPRFRNPVRYAAQDRDKVEILLDEAVLLKPLAWRKPRRIFVCSMTDLFGDWVLDSWIDRVFAVAALCPQHTFIILTKRAERMRNYFTGYRYERIYNAMGRLGDNGAVEPHPFRKAFPNGMPWPLPNVWLGVSVEDQRRADERIPLLFDTPAALRWISDEPSLGPLDLSRIPFIDGDPRNRRDALTGEALVAMDGVDGHPDIDVLTEPLLPRLDWVVVGGESGPKARPMHPDWARSLRDQCLGASVAFFFKQWGTWALGGSRRAGTRGKFAIVRPDGAPLFVDSYPRQFTSFGSVVMERVGKKKAGDVLDGARWQQFPITQIVDV